MKITGQTTITELAKETSTGLATYTFESSIVANTPPIIIIVAVGERHVALIQKLVIPQIEAVSNISKPNGKES